MLHPKSGNEGQVSRAYRGGSQTITGTVRETLRNEMRPAHFDQSTFSGRPGPWCRYATCPVWRQIGYLDLERKLLHNFPMWVAGRNPLFSTVSSRRFIIWRNESPSMASSRRVGLPYPNV